VRETAGCNDDSGVDLIIIRNIDISEHRTTADKRSYLICILLPLEKHDVFKTTCKHGGPCAILPVSDDLVGLSPVYALFQH